MNYNSTTIIDFWFRKLCQLLEDMNNDKFTYLNKIDFITFYVCSIDNVKRVDGTFNYINGFLECICIKLLTKKSNTFSKMLKSIISYIHKNVKIVLIGNIDLIPQNTVEMFNNFNKNIENPKLTLFLGIAYDYKNDILVESLNSIHKKKYTDELENLSHYVREQPNIDILIRTGGEFRTSGFFPTKIIYSELYFLKKYWPDFMIKDLNDILKDFYCNRDRRYGY